MWHKSNVTYVSISFLRLMGGLSKEANKFPYTMKLLKKQTYRLFWKILHRKGNFLL